MGGVAASIVSQLEASGSFTKTSRCRHDKSNQHDRFVWAFRFKQVSLPSRYRMNAIARGSPRTLCGTRTLKASPSSIWCISPNTDNYEEDP